MSGLRIHTDSDQVLQDEGFKIGGRSKANAAIECVHLGLKTKSAL